jgi:hypothetical protein
MPPLPFASIPVYRDPDFVTRGDILEQIDRRCSVPAARVALVGLGGVGYASFRKFHQEADWEQQIAAIKGDSPQIRGEGDDAKVIF